MSAEISPRVYGTEFEYGMLINGSEELPTNFFHNLPADLAGAGDFYQNGSRIYPDVGHAEYATPECGTLDDIVAAELAGEEIFVSTLQRLTQDNPQSSYRIHKRNIDSVGNTYGAHESYGVDQSIKVGTTDNVPERRRHYLIQALAVHYVSRIALVGGGYYNPNQREWHVSQRTGQLKQLSNSSCHTSYSRPLVDIRNEPLADATRFRRLHVSHGDPNVSPWALRTKIGMTSAFLRLLEADVPMEHLFLRDPLQSAYQVGDDIKISAKLELLDGRHMTALEMQKTLAEKVLDMAEAGHIPEDERIVAEDLYNTCGAAAKDLSALLRKADWYTRQQLIEEKAVKSKYGGTINGRLAGLDQMYDAVVCKQPATEPIAGIGKRLRDQGYFGPIDHDAIKHLQTSPPTSSRALLRGKIIEAASVPDISGRYGQLNASWSALRFGLPSNLRFDLSDPTKNKMNRLMRRILKKAEISLEN